jgi:hypothetical protein
VNKKPLPSGVNIERYAKVARGPHTHERLPWRKSGGAYTAPAQKSKTPGSEPRRYGPWGCRLKKLHCPVLPVNRRSVSNASAIIAVQLRCFVIAEASHGRADNPGLNALDIVQCRITIFRMSPGTIPYYAAAFMLFGSVARADLVTYNFTEVTSQTLRSLGTSFVSGCALLALGIVIAAFVSRKK